MAERDEFIWVRRSDVQAALDYDPEIDSQIAGDPDAYEWVVRLREAVEEA